MSRMSSAVKVNSLPITQGRCHLCGTYSPDSGPRLFMATIPPKRRLLPAMLNLVVENLAAARVVLLAKAVLKYDIESSALEVPADPSHPQQPMVLPRHPPPLALVRELLVTASAVFEAATAAGLLASREEANRVAPGSVRIE